MTVGFVVLNYGPPDMALAACRSIAMRAAGAVLVVVDNFSTEDHAHRAREGVAALRREISGSCFFIGLPENRGYGPGMNVGLRFLFAEQGVGVAFAVNSDITVHRFEMAEVDMNSLVAVTLIENGQRRVGASRFLPWLCLRRPLEGDWAGNKGQVYVEGCFLGFSRVVFEAVGGFSEEYFLYFEELDLVHAYRRARGAFPNIVHASGIVVEHKHGGATGMGVGCARSALAEYWSARSRIVFARKWIRPFLVSALLYNALLAARGLMGRRFDLAKAVWVGTRDAWRFDLVARAARRKAS